MNIQKLQEKLVRRNNPNWYKKKFKIKKSSNKHKEDWKELYRDFYSAIERDNT